MTRKPSLRRSAMFNFAGSALPMCVSLVTVPLYLAHIGAPRYGVLAIVWMLQGYFGYFDLGLSTATSNRIAQLSDASPAERESVLWTALLLNAGFGMIGGLALLALAKILLGHFHLDDALRAEALGTLPWVAASVPLATITGVFSGALSGRERFGTLNGVQVFSVTVFQTAPLVTAIVYGPSLTYLIPAAILGNVVSLAVLIGAVAFAFPLRFAGGPCRALVRSLFSYGAWVTVTNLISPLLEAADRLLIGKMLGPQAVAHYQVPSNLALRVRILPGVISTTLFPRLSALGTTDATELATRTTLGLASALTPTIVFGMFLMHPFLVLWTGEAFASHAGSIGEIILAGVWINSLGFIPYNHLQATGRPGVVARIHALEIVPYFAGLWWALGAFGLTGAAFAWSGRVLVDVVLLFWAARFGARIARQLVMPALFVLAALASTLWLAWPSPARIVAWIVITGASLAWSIASEPFLRERAAAAIASLREYRWRRA